MLYRFPPGLMATVIRAYQRPYDDPVKGRAGDVLTPDFIKETDSIGWIWCRNQSGQEGWVPESWLTQDGEVFRLIRDFDAIELSVAPGQVAEMHLSESGFCWVTLPSGETGWVPDAVLALKP